ncbi:MAG: hypothetical protein JSU86_14285 [Phycisphaerales bacterium]|nr:MAG: hypothetical protein JSU86_14285 [Phycisphaerales bacterium]
MIRSRDHSAVVLSFRLRDNRFKACNDSRVTLIQVFADSSIGQQGTRVDGQPEQVNRVLFVQSGLEIVFLLGLRQLFECEGVSGHPAECGEARSHITRADTAPKDALAPF